MLFQGRLTARVCLRVGAAVSLAALLAGCSAGPLDTRAAYETSDGGGADGQSAMASLPPAAGAPVAVLQSQSHGVLTQRVVLRGDPNTIGENSIVVRINVDRGPTDLDGPVGLPTRSRIAGELDDNFAGVDMGVSQTFARNSFGPFGYAVGHPRAGETCLYAWQFAVWKPGLLGAGPEGAPSLPTQPTSVRVRLCRTSIGEAEMVQMLRDLQVYPPHSRLAYMDPAYTGEAHAGDALGAAGVGSFMAPDAPAPVVRERLKPHRRRFAHHRHRHAPRVVREERAVADDLLSGREVAPPLRGGFTLPVPPSPSSSMAVPPASNPLLAPLAAPAAHADDLPLPGRQSAPPPQANAAPARASIPLPN
jgi:hypothetical protein